MVDVLEAQLHALRAALETALAQVQACLVVIGNAKDVPEPCPHRHLENVGTIGAPVFECQDCGATIADTRDADTH